MRDRRAERREATRAEIVAAAWEVVGENGIGALSLRDVAERVGMRPPSLYEYFDSKNAIYDALFADGQRMLYDALTEDKDLDPLEQMRARTHDFIDFCVQNPARTQLLFVRTIPGFEPSPESYALAVRTLTAVNEAFADLGVDDPSAVDLYTAMISGLVNQQLANEPGGKRWVVLADEMLDMLLDHLRKTGRLTEGEP
ncbi:TetR/AcrR family transcriptional regulator [Tenggerimyces flavus]|uniref:TetR/AcrR family transcriptional regulator n=1 Tax=Tenggerimyces flavus TaxID=1708749 RepID=A0ABV7YR40_9ACTN|nr:TetR/AcrR family transcriptional regulator [Tenggerimyces flavus]MBM7784625.1 AcrR family transcriptional regulator [Tenggerimyces flavus]